MLLDDIFELYEIKCGKYKPEQLTERLKGVLFREAIAELQLMNYISKKGERQNG